MLLPAISALVLAQAGLTEVPFRVADSALIVDAVVNGRKASLMFDTGFGGSVVLSDTIDIGPPSGTMTLRDFVGEFQAKTVKVKTLQLGHMAIEASGMQVVQQPTRNMSFGYNMHTDGIMGLEVIKKYVTKFDFQNQKFVFYPKSVDISQRKPDNKTTFLGKLLPIGNDSLEMLVTAPNGRTMVMALDTGNSFYATTHKDVLERVGLWPSGQSAKFMRLSGIASGAVDSWSVRMPPMSVFGVPAQSSVWSVIDLPSSAAESDGTIGFEFLKNFNITVDFERRRVWFENFTGKTGSEPTAELGLFGGYRDRTKKVQVWRVTPGSPADIAGIKEGDEILSVNEENLSGTSFRRLDTLMEGPLGSKVRLAISRGGQLKRYELERAYLVNELPPPTRKD
ncbi:MAG: hypothetical protein QOJ65_2281 [Fimbriimonadaceae bacterium]|jgi:predicted aspartyl protease|nr:hypothetical protein [Fimbriimonadaceae bacterium]